MYTFFVFEGGPWIKFTVMVTVTTVLKAVSLFVAEFISSITDWFQTKPAWANLEVLEETELKTTGGGKSETVLYFILCIITFL